MIVNVFYFIWNHLSVWKVIVLNKKIFNFSAELHLIFLFYRRALLVKFNNPQNSKLLNIMSVNSVLMLCNFLGRDYF